MNIEENKLYQKLIKHDDSLTEEAFENAVYQYNHLLDYYLGRYFTINSKRDTIFNVPKIFFGGEDRYYFKIFVKIIEMQKKGLLKYIDYVLLLDNNLSFATDVLLLKYLYEYLEEVCVGDDYYIKDRIEQEFDLIENLTQYDLEYLLESKVVPDSYKAIVNLYKDLFEDYYYGNNYHELETGNPAVELSSFLNLSFYYFLINDLLKSKPDEVLAFLSDVKSNMGLYIERINLAGIKDNNDLLIYIDFIYKEREKIKIFK